MTALGERSIKTNVKTNVETNVWLMFWARWTAGWGPLDQPGGAQQGQPQSSPAGLGQLLRLNFAWLLGRPVIAMHCV